MASIKAGKGAPEPVDRSAGARLAIHYVDARLLVPYAKNARTHSESQVDQIAASLLEFGWTAPILLDGERGVVAGHGRLLAAQRLWAQGKQIARCPSGLLPCVNLDGLTAAQKRAYVIADNQLALRAGWNEDLLRAEMGQLKLEGFELGVLGFKLPDLNRLLGGAGQAADPVPDVPEIPVSCCGDVWNLGEHRVMCGDTTDPAAIAHLLAGGRPVLIHADPPYGMGKEADGIQNDNLYEAELDRFQMTWWRAWIGHATENASAYIWGQPPDLWRLWWKGGLRDEPGKLFARNEIVWDKGAGFGMTGEGAHSFVVSTERCLFLMRGDQFLGNQNKADYWEGYEPLRSWLEDQRDAAGWTNRDVDKLTKTQMAGHWFSKSQFHPIAREHYEALSQAAAGRAFLEPYDELFERLFPGIKQGGNARRRELSAELRERRSYFDNTHDSMTEVWSFTRVSGEERFGHATPKPVAMVERAIVSSSQEGDLVAAPFGGTGPEVVAAERTGRRCVTMEIEPAYVDIIVSRWEGVTNRHAVLEASSATFEETGRQRARAKAIA